MSGRQKQQQVTGFGDEVLLALVLTLPAIVVWICFLVQDLRRHHRNSQRLTAATTAANESIARMAVGRVTGSCCCPICLNDLSSSSAATTATATRLPVQTNCGHVFCSPCFTAYWRHSSSSPVRPVRCPVCRQTVTVILNCFPPLTPPLFVDPSSCSSSGSSGDRHPHPHQHRREDAVVGQEYERAIASTNEYNRRFSGEPRSLVEHLRDLPTLLRHLSSDFLSLGGLVAMIRIRIVICFVAAIMYLVSPLDLIPEAFFGVVGLADDVFVVLLIACYVALVYRNVLATRWQQQPSSAVDEDLLNESSPPSSSSLAATNQPHSRWQEEAAEARSEQEDHH